MSYNIDSWLKDVETQLLKLSPGEREVTMTEINRVLQKPPSIVSSHYNSTTTSHRPVGSSARSFFKWATIGVLLMFGFFIASIILIPIAVFKFLAVDNFQKDFSFTWGNSHSEMKRFEGKLNADSVENFTLNLSNGQVTVAADIAATEISYDCEIDSDHQINSQDAAKSENGVSTITLLNVEHAECDITVPTKVPLNINVTNGQISLTQMSQPVEANLTAGEIEFEANDQASFDLSASVQSGTVDGLKDFQMRQKKGPQIYPAVLSVGTGKIDIE